MQLDKMVKHEPVSLSWEMFEAIRDVLDAAQAIGDSFTTPKGEFISDDLTRAEWFPLREALDRLAAQQTGEPR
jgi:hypothetical protein